MIDVHWTLTVQVPQLDRVAQQLERLVETVESIIAEVRRMSDTQVASASAIAEQIERIADEAEEYATQGTVVTPEQMNNLGSELRRLADTAEKQVDDLKANTEAISKIVPTSPPSA